MRSSEGQNTNDVETIGRLLASGGRSSFRTLITMLSAFSFGSDRASLKLLPHYHPEWANAFLASMGVRCTVAIGTGAVSPEMDSPALRARLATAFSFENLAVGDPNRRAVAAALAASRAEAPATSPLCLFGGIGVGKTHLLLAMSREYIADSPGASVLYTTGDRLGELVVEHDRGRFAATSALWLIDEFDTALGDCRLSAGEAVRTLIRRRCRVVLASRSTPTELIAGDPGLRSVFRSGTTEKLGDSDPYMRLAVLELSARTAGVSVSPDAIRHIASSFGGSVRALERVIVRMEGGTAKPLLGLRLSAWAPTLVTDPLIIASPRIS